MLSHHRDAQVKVKDKTLLTISHQPLVMFDRGPRPLLAHAALLELLATKLIELDKAEMETVDADLFVALIEP